MVTCFFALDVMVGLLWNFKQFQDRRGEKRVGSGGHFVNLGVGWYFRVTSHRTVDELFYVPEPSASKYPVRPCPGLWLVLCKHGGTGNLGRLFSFQGS